MEDLIKRAKEQEKSNRKYFARLKKKTPKNLDNVVHQIQMKFSENGLLILCELL